VFFKGRTILIMKRVYLWVFILFVVMRVCAFGEAKVSVSHVEKIRGFVIGQFQYGSGIGFFYERERGKVGSLYASVCFITVNDATDIPLYDYYYGIYYERSDKKRLNFLSFMFGYKRFLFVDEMEGSFKPHLRASVGPVLYMDPPNIPDFSRRIREMKAGVSVGGGLAGGVEFIGFGRTVFSFDLGYQCFCFARKVEGRTSYQGLFLKIYIGRRI